MAKDEVGVGEKRRRGSDGGRGRRGGARGACSGDGMEEENGSDQLGVGLLDPDQSLAGVQEEEERVVGAEGLQGGRGGIDRPQHGETATRERWVTCEPKRDAAVTPTKDSTCLRQFKGWGRRPDPSTRHESNTTSVTWNLSNWKPALLI